MRAGDDVDVVMTARRLKSSFTCGVYWLSLRIDSTGDSSVFSIDSSCSVISSGKVTKSAL
jgi:hypothetical protein